MKIYESSKSGHIWKEVPVAAGDFADAPVLSIDPEIRYQRFLGVGSDVTECTCQNILRLPPDKQDDYIRLLFDRKTGAGLSVVRDDIGSSDFTAGRYSLAMQFDDVDMQSFSFARETLYTIPILRKILQVNPDVYVVASVWSPPEWMKDTKSMVGKGGKLLPKYYPAFARYLVQYIRGMAQYGIPVRAITIQNEPRADHGGEKGKQMPQCLYTPEEERAFVQQHLYPLFQREGIETEIWGMDHNFNMTDYVDVLLRDGAGGYNGIAWHHYEGKPEAMRKIYDRYGIAQHFTEGQIMNWSSRRKASGKSSLASIFRNRADCLINWITMLNSEGGPGEGEFIEKRDVHDAETFDLSIYDLTNGSVYYAPALWMMGHLGRYVARGAYAVRSDAFLNNVAFQNPDGSVVLYIENNGRDARDTAFQIAVHGKRYGGWIPAYSVQTYVFEG